MSRTQSSERIMSELMDRPLTQPQLVQITGIAYTTVHKACQRLKRKGLIIVIGRRKASPFSGGRPFDVYAMARTAITSEVA